MRVFSAKVRDGALVTEFDLDLPDGTEATVVVDADEKTFEVSPEQEAELLESLKEADRGEVIPAAEMLRRLAR